MHPRQASVLAEITAVLATLSGKTAAAATPAPSGPILLWKYQDPEDNHFYLEVKKTTIKSPFSGKSFSVRPERYTPAQVGKELKDERKEQAKHAGQEDLVEYVNRIAAQQTVLWQYKDQEGRLFWLDRKVTTTIRSPYGGPSFTGKPKKILPSQIGKLLKEEAEEAKAEDAKMDDSDEPTDVKAFAAKVIKVALSPQCKKFLDDRAFIGSVKDLGFPRMDRAKFDSMLIGAHRSGQLRLTRADLVGAMDLHDVEHSEVRYQDATFHFVAIDDHVGPAWRR
jgi:hypothetical protein